MSELHVEALYAYPVKSCAPLNLHESAVTPQGLQYDREWVVTRPNGTFLSQRNCPELALVRTNLSDGELVLSAPSNGSIAIPLERDAHKEKQAELITIFSKQGTAYTEGQEVNDFLSDFIGKSVLLKRSVKPRPINPVYRQAGASDSSRLADGFPLLLASAASLDLLSEYAGRRLNMVRFRPNIVVAGEALEPYAEDYWRELRIGSVQAFVVKACARCPIPDVNPTTGLRDTNRVVTHALQETRSGTHPGKEKIEVLFGQNLLHTVRENDVLTVGDTVAAVTTSWRPNYEPF